MRVPEKPWLSVIIPTFQGARYLEEALESIAQARDPGVEVLAVDDGSTDATATLLDVWRRRLPMRVTLGPRGGNWVRTTNLGLRQARGEWICFLHQDDRWAPDRAARLRAAAAAHPEIEWIVHAARFIDARGAPRGRWRCPLPAGRPVPSRTVLPRLLLQNFIPMPAPAIRRTRIARIGPMDESLWYFADWDYWLRLAALGPVLYLPEPLADFRLHAHSQTARRTRDRDAVMRQFDVVTARALALAPLSRRAQRRARRGVRFARVAYRFLLDLAHGQRPAWPATLRECLRAGPGLWLRYLHAARLAERALPRLRLGGPRPRPGTDA